MCKNTNTLALKYIENGSFVCRSIEYCFIFGATIYNTPYMKTSEIVNKMKDSFKVNGPVQTYLDLETISGCQGRTLQRKIKDCNLLASYNKNSKFYTLPGLARFNSHGIWPYRQVLFSHQGNLYKTLVYLVGQSKGGHTGKELSEIVQVKTDDALRVLCQQGRLQRQKYGGHYVYYAVGQPLYQQQQATRTQATALPQNYCPPRDKEVTISVLVEIVRTGTLRAKQLLKGLKKHKVVASEQEVNGIIAHYGLKKKTFK